MPTILFTGGGSAGHVTPNIALIDYYQRQKWNIAYVGSQEGIEAQLIKPLNIPYYAINCGKLRRYWDWRNFIMPFQVLHGIGQSISICRRLKPDVIFSKGGFVALPLVIAAWICRIPVIAHEADLTPGLANRLSFPFVKKICVTFDKTQLGFKSKGKVVVTGIPIRQQLLRGNKEQGLNFCGFNSNKPVLLCVGGSLGAISMNRTLRQILPTLLQKFQIIHICGKDKVDNTFNTPGYKQVEYLHDELADVFACTDYVISRAGANAIIELLYLAKPNLLIPLSKAVSRGDQIINADFFAEKGYSVVLPSEKLTSESLIENVDYLVKNHDHYKQTLMQAVKPDAIKLISEAIGRIIK